MRFKDRIKGLNPEVFEQAAEGLLNGSVCCGACLAISEAQFRVTPKGPYTGIGYTSPYHKLLDDTFQQDSPERGSTYWFGPIMRYAERSDAIEANQHRVMALLLLAEMIRHARQ